MSVGLGARQHIVEGLIDQRFRTTKNEACDSDKEESS